MANMNIQETPVKSIKTNEWFLCLNSYNIEHTYQDAFYATLLDIGNDRFAMFGYHPQNNRSGWSFPLVDDVIYMRTLTNADYQQFPLPGSFRYFNNYNIGKNLWYNEGTDSLKDLTKYNKANFNKIREKPVKSIEMLTWFKFYKDYDNMEPFYGYIVSGTNCNEDTNYDTELAIFTLNTNRIPSWISYPVNKELIVEEISSSEKDMLPNPEIFTGFDVTHRLLKETNVLISGLLNDHSLCINLRK